jgi:hypothetical protein
VKRRTVNQTRKLKTNFFTTPWRCFWSKIRFVAYLSFALLLNARVSLRLQCSQWGDVIPCFDWCSFATLLCRYVVRLWSKFLVASRLRFLLRRIVPVPSTFLTGAIVRCLHWEWFWCNSGYVWLGGGRYLPSLAKWVLSLFTVTKNVPSGALSRLSLSTLRW